MSRNGSGVYTPPAASYPAVSGTLIESAKFNATIDDIATALTESVAVNGQTTMTGDLPMGAHKVTGVGNGVAATDVCAYGQAGSAAIAETYAATSKATPVDADVLPLADSAASFGLKKLTWANAKATLKTHFDSLYFSTGDAKLTFKTTADSGWVMMDDKTVGNAASGATGRANADTEALFALLWTNISDTYCAVSGGRGASAAADYAANKTIALPKTLGRALGIAGSGASLTARALGEVLGAETHTLAAAEGPVHSHPASQAAHNHTTDASETGGGSSGTLLSAPSNGAPTKSFTTSNATPAVTVSNNTTGGGAHNNMQPTSFINAMVKL